MKKQKRLEKYVYEGLGFPIVLLNVPMIEVRGVWVPNINFNLLQKTVLIALAFHPSALTGNQIRFIRSWFEMTLSGFGMKFGVSHAAVLKWEKSGNKSAKISLTTQKAIRQLIIDSMVKSAEDFRIAFRDINQLDFNLTQEVLQIDAKKELIAI